MDPYPKHVKRVEKQILLELTVRKSQEPDVDYLNQLQSDLLSVVSHTPKPKIVPFYKRWYNLTAIAASIVVIFTLNWNSSAPPLRIAAKNKIDFSMLSREEIVDYIEENSEEFELEAIADQLDSIPSNWNSPLEASTTVATTSPATEILFNDLNKDEILNYLKEEAIDLDDDLLLGS